MVREAEPSREAFEREALPHLRQVWAAAVRFCRDPIEAEDLVQETYLRAYRTFDSYRLGTNCRAWLLTILYSVFVNRYRRSRREPEAQDPATLESLAERERAPADWERPLLDAATAGRWGTGETVEAALGELSEEFREAVLLVDVEELTYEEAAGVLGCPVGTVRSRLFRGRRLLARALGEYARASGYVTRSTT